MTDYEWTEEDYVAEERYRLGLPQIGDESRYEEIARSVAEWQVLAESEKS